MSLPVGASVSSDLARDHFLASPLAEDATPWVSHGPYGSYRLPGGHIERHEMNVLLFFYDETLTMVQFGFNFYPAAAEGWDSWSAEIEMRAKSFQEDILRHDLGEPHAVSTRTEEAPEAFQPLRDTLRWAYNWGEVASLNDAKSGSTYVLVEYAGRRERAYAEYQRWKRQEARRAALQSRQGGLREFFTGLWRR